MNAIVNFVGYMAASCALLAVFMVIYSKITPYNEFKEVSNNNTAAAVAFGGAILGFTLPMVSAIFFTHSFVEMLKWAAVTGVVQLLVFGSVRRYAVKIEAGQVAPATLLAFLAVSVGLLNAVCISY
jgi:putative membrane protein